MMLTGRGNNFRSVARVAPVFPSIIQIPHCDKNDSLKAAIKQKMDYCSAKFGKVKDTCYCYGNKMKRYRTMMNVSIDGPIIPFSRQIFTIAPDVTGYCRRCCPFSLVNVTLNFIRTIATNCNSSSGSDKNAKMRLIMIRLYRVLQRLCRTLVPTIDGIFLLQHDISASDWGNYHIHINENSDDISTESQTQDLMRLFLILSGNDSKTGIFEQSNWYKNLMGLDPTTIAKNNASKACWTTPMDLRDAVRFAFRSSLMSSQDPSDSQALAVLAIQIMQNQVELWNQSSISNTPNGLVRVTATSRCLGAVSTVSITPTYSQLDPKFRFAYRIRIENISSSETVQLFGRYWHISEIHEDDATRKTLPEPIEVDAPYTGAVGQLPVLQPGQSFEYVSGTDLTTPKGEMKGHLYMATVPPQTRSAKSGDDVIAIACPGSKGSLPTGIARDDDVCKQTKLFQACVKPFRLDCKTHSRKI